MSLRVTARSLRAKSGRQQESPEHDDDERGEEPSRAARPETEQVDAAVVLPLDEQDRRDQVAAEDEEEIDAEEAAGQPRASVGVRPRVVEEDADDRKGS